MKLHRTVWHSGTHCSDSNSLWVGRSWGRAQCRIAWDMGASCGGGSSSSISIISGSSIKQGPSGGPGGLAVVCGVVTGTDMDAQLGRV